MTITQPYAVESVQAEGKNSEFTRIELETTNNEPGDDNMAEISILTDATDVSDFTVGRSVRVSFEFDTKQ